MRNRFAKTLIISTIIAGIHCQDSTAEIVALPPMELPPAYVPPDRSTRKTTQQSSNRWPAKATPTRKKTSRVETLRRVKQLADFAVPYFPPPNPAAKTGALNQPAARSVKQQRQDLPSSKSLIQRVQGQSPLRLDSEVEDLLMPGKQFDLSAPNAAKIPTHDPARPTVTPADEIAIPPLVRPRTDSRSEPTTAESFTPARQPSIREDIEDLLMPDLPDNAAPQTPLDDEPQQKATIHPQPEPVAEPFTPARQPSIREDIEDLLMPDLPDNAAPQTPRENERQQKPTVHPQQDPVMEKQTPATQGGQTPGGMRPHGSGFYDGHRMHGGSAHSSTDQPSANVFPGKDPHVDLFAHTPYPSAKSCRKCHEKIYDEWASSSHAYAAISPMFQRFEQTLTNLTKGTLGYFCMRCHAPVATALNHPRELPIWDGIPSAHEGVTCIACHRVREQYGKANGQRRIEPGDIFDPVYGSGYGEKLQEILAQKSHYKVKTSYDDKSPGQEIHNRVIHFEQLTASEFCVSCHQVAVYPGIKLEVVWEQYRASPACKQGISCQDCHMGIEPGVALGYEAAPVAVVNDKEIDPHHKHSNHMFYGPGYSIAHPGVFPFNAKADEFDWNYQDWLQFDWRAGWGTDAFEEAVDEGRIQVAFPPVWREADDRYDAREIIDENLNKLESKRQMRHRLMENGSELSGPYFDKLPRYGQPLKFHYVVNNTNLGHNMPSGSLGAQPQLWINVVLTGPRGQRVWESGYVDRNGDLADLHSFEVAAGRIPRDLQLVNFQTKFLTSNVKGPDREMYLPINIDIDQSPFIRPSGFPITTMNHPPFIRMEGHSIAPLGSRKAKYRIPARLMTEPGVYRLSVRMRSRAEPIYFMRFCGSTPEMERSMNEWMLDFHEETHTFVVQ